mmetsp:Transcript_62198/g.148393  ORF Transcript_62198/g.148393 Transcript_62198/m.148393 type:complete len:202 (-) Transcript_62198:198-803(-)
MLQAAAHNTILGNLGLGFSCSSHIISAANCDGASSLSAIDASAGHLHLVVDLVEQVAGENLQIACGQDRSEQRPLQNSAADVASTSTILQTHSGRANSVCYLCQEVLGRCWLGLDFHKCVLETSVCNSSRDLRWVHQIGLSLDLHIGYLVQCLVGRGLHLELAGLVHLKLVDHQPGNSKWLGELPAQLRRGLHSILAKEVN